MPPEVRRSIALGTALPVDENLRLEAFNLVCRHVRGLVGTGAPDFEDLVQTAAERALRDLPQFEGRSSLSTWIFRLCYSVLLTHRRWYRRWLRRFTLSYEGEMPEHPSLSPAPNERSEWRERNARLRAAVGRVSPKLRVVLVLHDFEDVGVEEIADMLQVNVLTIRSRLRDGRRDLARRLTKDSYFGDQAGKGEK